MDGIKLTTVITGVEYPFDSFEAAARFWDSQTYGRPAPVGGIAVQEFRDGIMVRDGWLMHVGTDGSVYVNPTFV